MKFVLVLSLLTGFFGPCISDTVEKSYPRVTTPLGVIEGFYNTAFKGRSYEAYEGIPYAQPPVGDLRFEVPKSISGWSDVRMAKGPGPACLQYDFLQKNLSQRVTGSEDCLYLNIYTPARVAGNSCSKVNGTDDQLKPVIFFIHGGSFILGSGSQYGPKYLLDRDVILVTINYRLGPLGFLSTEDEVVPGNMALKDQVIALHWVNDNIKSFGGDPSRITLFGQSAGGASVHYHYLTNLTAGLFQRGMSLSGTALNPWALSKNPLKNAKKLAGIVGCPINDTKTMVECLKSQPGAELVNSFSNFSVSDANPTHAWTPTVEKTSGDFTFVDRPPIDILNSGDVQDLPWVTGVVSEDGLYPVAAYIADESLFVQLNDSWETVGPQILYFDDRIPTENQAVVANLIRKQYLAESPITRETFDGIKQMSTDWMFFDATAITVLKQAQANESPVHVYYFSYRGAHSVSEVLSGSSENFGVCHVDDLGYPIDAPLYLDPTTTVEDLQMQNMLIDLWVSFATNGTLDVDVDWPRLNAASPLGELNLLHIRGPKNVVMENTTNFGNVEFWKSLGLHRDME